MKEWYFLMISRDTFDIQSVYKLNKHQLENTSSSWMQFGRIRYKYLCAYCLPCKIFYCLTKATDLTPNNPQYSATSTKLRRINQKWTPEKELLTAAPWIVVLTLKLFSVPCFGQASAQVKLSPSPWHRANLLLLAQSVGKPIPLRAGISSTVSQTHLLAALLLYIAPTKLGFVQTVGADTTVFWNLTARTLPAAPGAPALLHWRLLLCLVSGDWLDGLDRWSKRFSLFWASYRRFIYQKNIPKVNFLMLKNVSGVSNLAHEA